MRLRGRLGFLGVALLIGGSPFAQSASAADIAVVTEDRFAEAFEPADGWTFRVTPYAWIMGLEGSQTIRGRTVDVSASFIDILENSDSLIGLMGYAEARKGRWGIFGDGVYSAITASGGATHDFTGPFGRVKGTLDAALGLDIQMFTGEAGVAYEVLQWGSSEGSSDGHRYFGRRSILVAGGRSGPEAQLKVRSGGPQSGVGEQGGRSVR